MVECRKEKIYLKTHGGITMKVFYARVSTQEQNEARQEAAAKAAGCEKIFLDKASGKNAERKALKEMLSFVRQGDVVIVSEISRLARNTTDLLSIVGQLTEKGVEFISLKESIDTNTPAGQFMLTVFGALATLERETIRARQAEGIAEAKKIPGKYKGRKPKDIDKDEFKKLCAEWRQGNRTAVSIQRKFNITAQTFYRWVKEQSL
jgi:DNA invertase Pin-like site-specific DNA recombinase